ncbi:family 43 glycosylhydrolase [Kineococcus sp. SYSU DK004]|uniref:family 43 glycosylhydrolase n=1 Tax=Kineococcus sp. SYSU DK004 TaxID=3383125 RepID=UPI003D7E31DF
MSGRRGTGPRGRRGGTLAAAAAALVLASCTSGGGTGGGGGGSGNGPGADPEPSLTAAPATPGAVVGGGDGPPEEGWFEPGTTWVGDFGDPDVLLHEGTYYAWASPVGGRYLPVLTSTDLVTWTVRERYTDDGPPGAPGYDVFADEAIPVEVREAGMDPWPTYDTNDALVRRASWGLPHQQGPWMDRDYWAPGVLPIGDTWYAYSAVRVAPDRFCLTVAEGPGPAGPFRDTTGDSPLQCQPVERDPQGSIDPQPWRDPATGRTHLLWKASGKLDVRESSIQAVELGDDGRPLPGAEPVTLLETNRDAAWEGSTVENPSMVAFGGTTYLFYSANYSGVLDDSGRSNYATGYAVCPDGPTAPCTRPEPAGPLLASQGTVQGPGGSNGFVDADGTLRVAYASFWLGENRGGEFPHPRRLGIATLERAADGTLDVVDGPVPTEHEVTGAIREEWLATGGEDGPLGPPTSDELTTPDGRGAYSHFLGGSVYWSPATGAHVVRGAIQSAWGDTGWESGPLGFPVSDEYEVPGGLRSDFEGGSLVWDASTGDVRRP